MKTNKLLFAAALAAGAIAIFSCKKDNQEQPVQGSFDAKISGKFVYTTKSAVDAEGNVTWLSNDSFSVNGVDYILQKGSGSAEGVIIPAEAGLVAEPLVDTPLFRACSPATIFNEEKGQYELPSTILNYGGYNPMYAFSNDNKLEFKNILGMLELTVKGSKSIKSIELACPNVGLAGRYKISRDKVDTTVFVMTNTNDFNGAVTIEFDQPVALSVAGKTFLLPVAAKTYKCLMARFIASDGMIADYLISTVEAPIEIGVDQRVPFICTPEFKTGNNQLLSGVFSVSATKHIQFTEGNLYWDSAKKKFGIEAFQFGGSPLELSGSSANSYGGRLDPTRWSHFIWSASAEEAIAPTIKQVAKAGDKLFCIDGGAIAGLTLPTADEMTYLLTGRTVNGGQGKNKSYKVLFDAGYKLNGQGGLAGLLLYPDNYTGSYKEETWEELKTAGIVYLPTTGYYNTTNDWCGQLKGSSSYFLKSTPDSNVQVECLQLNKDKKDAFVAKTDINKFARTIRLVKYLD